MHIPLVASIRLALGVLLLRRVVLVIADVVGRGEDVVVQIVALVVVFLSINTKIYS
jgi:hypothetical protein